ARRAGGAGRHRDDGCEITEVVGLEVDPNDHRLLGLERKIARGLDRECRSVAADGKLDADLGQSVSVVVDERELLRGDLVHHYVAEVERVAGERGETAHRVPADG